MKNTISKCSASAVTALAAFSAFAAKIFAAGADFTTQAPTAPSVASQMTLGENITQIINYFLGILGLVAVAFLIYAGVLMVTAGGAEEQVTKARKIIMYAVAGIVIIIISWSVVTFVTSIFG